MSEHILRIAFYETEPWEEAYLNEAFPEAECWFYPEPLDQNSPNIRDDVDVVSVFIRSVVDQTVLNKLANLKLVATRSTGFDHIDVDACRTRGITVVNVPTYGENTVAEHTFGLILSLSRNIHKAHVRTERGDFSMKGLSGFDLHRKTLGVVGAGRIGLHVIRIAKGFAMNVVAFDPKPDQLIAEVLGFEYLPLDEVLSESDIVTLHAPYNARTHHLINADNIKRMKRGALLINTARGPLLDSEALLAAIDSGGLAGAGLDVLEGEELISEERELLTKPDAGEKLKALVLSQALLRRENVVVTPHIAFDSREALRRILDTTVENIRAFSHEQALNVIISPAEKRAA